MPPFSDVKHVYDPETLKVMGVVADLEESVAERGIRSRGCGPRRNRDRAARDGRFTKLLTT
jgi:hypothetical protein